MSTILLTVAMTLSGCRLLASPGAEADATVTEAAVSGEKLPVYAREGDETDDLLSYYRLTGELSQATVPDRIERLRTRLIEDRCDEARLRTVMLASRLPPGEGEALGLKLLEPCVDDPFARYSATGADAILLNDMFANRAARQQAAAAREREQRRAGDLAEEVERLRTEVTALEQQLEGLKAIERSIQERDRERPTEE